MIIKAYDISEKYTMIKLNDIQIKNINKIFDELLGNKNKSNSQINVICKVDEDKRNDDNLLFKYKNSNTDQFDFDEFAERLTQSEKKKDGVTRNKSIQEGFLFIKSNEIELQIMKLEKIEDVDSTSFEIKHALGTDQNFYKICVFRNDLDKVMIFDKNTRLASYWYDKFLGLVRVRDNEINTDDFIDLIKEEKLFDNSLIQPDKVKKVYSCAEDYLFNHDYFSKSDLITDLKSKGMLDIEVDNIYSEYSKCMDSSFDISEKSIRRKYNKTFKVSDNIEVKTDNYILQIKRRKIRLNEKGQLILEVDNKYLEKIKELIKKAKGKVD